MGTMPIDFDIPIVEELFTRSVTEIAVLSDEDSCRLRGMAQSCPDGTILSLGSGLSQEENLKLHQQFPNAICFDEPAWRTGTIGGPPAEIAPFGTQGPTPSPTQAKDEQDST
jgi:hypothetical protein